MKIYLACPYTDPCPRIMEARFQIINKEAGRLMQQGHLVFSPISHTHPIAVACELPRGFDFWQAYDRTFIDWCEELWVCRMDGWAKSKGVMSEIKMAIELGKKVVYLPKPEA